MNFRLVILLSVVTLLLSGCVRTYRIDIQQGNIVTPEQIEQLKPGMQKAEVRYLLGAPLVEDPFHTERWDYFYSFRSGETRQVKQQRLTVFFDNGQLTKIEQGFESEPLTSSSSSSESPVQVPGKPTKPGFLKRAWRRLWPLDKTQSN